MYEVVFTHVVDGQVVEKTRRIDGWLTLTNLLARLKEDFQKDYDLGFDVKSIKQVD